MVCRIGSVMILLGLLVGCSKEAKETISGPEVVTTVAFQLHPTDCLSISPAQVSLSVDGVVVAAAVTLTAGQSSQAYRVSGGTVHTLRALLTKQQASYTTSMTVPAGASGLFTISCL